MSNSGGIYTRTGVGASSIPAMELHSWRNSFKGAIYISLFLFFLGQGAVAEIEVHHHSDLADINCFTAIMSMSGAQKTNWWHFLPYLEASSDEAFIAYMISSFTPDSITGACSNFTAEVDEKRRLLATRSAAIAEYSSTEKIDSLGEMKISMWALGFACLDAPPTGCNKFTPVVLKEIGGNKTAFFSVWERDAEAQSVTNSITARIWELPTKEEKTDESEVSLRVLSGSNSPDLCEGLAMEDKVESSTTILLNSTNFKSQPVVKVAAEAAGFSAQVMPNESKSFCRKTRPLCLMGIETSDPNPDDPSAILNVTSAQTRILLSFMSHVKNSYIQAQNSALELQHPGTDFWMAAIALPSAFIAVFAAAFPFINMQLRLFQGVRTSKRLKIVILCVCNTILSAISYSAAIALIPAELQRQKSFKTWGLLADQIPINKRLQVLVVVQGESTYFSYSLLVVMLSVGILLPPVVCITIYRCKQVFRRVRLLKDLREVRSELDDVQELDPDQTRVDDLQAIEMSNVEEHLLVKKLAKLRSLRKRASLLPELPSNSRGGRRSINITTAFSRSQSDLWNTGQKTV